MGELKIWRRAVLGLLLLTLICSGFAWKCLHHPGINFLPRHRDGKWILFPAAVDTLAHPTAYLDTRFRRTFDVQKLPRAAQLKISAAKRFEFKINGHTIGPNDARNWKDVSTIDILSLLQIGRNVLEVRVFNNNAPPALWLRLSADEKILQSDTNWETSLAGSSWRPAVNAFNPRFPGGGNPAAGGEQIVTVVRKVWPIWLAFACFAAVICFIGRRLLGKLIQGRFHAAIAVPILFAGFWIALFWNNNHFLPLHAGFDSRSHLEYIRFVQEHRAVPLPTQGFEMFQPPLYYALSAGALSLCRLTVDDASGVQLLRWLTMAAGIAHFIFVFLSLRLLLPDRPGPQFVGLAVAAFLPMHLYLCHYVTNEVLVAALIAGAFYSSLHALKMKSPSLPSCAWLGIFLGAAMLTKATAALFFVPLGGALLVKHIRERSSFLTALRTFAVPFSICLALCGWYYIWIWHTFGTPLVGNWNPSATHFAWWQDPGFHTTADLVRFGRSLIDPLLSGFAGIPDGVYSTLWGDGLLGGLADFTSRTPWNYNLMTGGYALAIVPMIVILIGAIVVASRWFRSPSPEGLLLLGFCALLVCAVIWMCLNVASYAQIKAFYALSALTPICYFAATGWDAITRRNKSVQLIGAALLLVWATNSFASVWIRDSAQQHVYNAARWSFENKIDISRSEAIKAVRTNPVDVSAQRILSVIALASEHLPEAREHAERAVELSPTDSDAHAQLAAVLLKQAQLDQTIGEARRAIDLGPENASAYEILFTALRQSQRTGEAMEVARNGLAVSPFDPQLHYRFGLAAGQIADYATAVQQFEYAILLRLPGPDAREKLRVALPLLSQTLGGPEQLGELAVLTTIAGDAETADLCKNSLPLSSSTP